MGDQLRTDVSHTMHTYKNLPSITGQPTKQQSPIPSEQTSHPSSTLHISHATLSVSSTHPDAAQPSPHPPPPFPLSAPPTAHRPTPHAMTSPPYAALVFNCTPCHPAISSLNTSFTNRCCRTTLSPANRLDSISIAYMDPHPPDTSCTYTPVPSSRQLSLAQVMSSQGKSRQVKASHRAAEKQLPEDDDDDDDGRRKGER